MRKLKFILPLFALFLGVTACEKYPDGGSKGKAEKNLTSGHWTLESYLLNGVDATSTLVISNYMESFTSDGAYSRSYTDPDGASKTASGTWQFESEKSLLGISGPGSFELSTANETVSASDYTVLKLDKESLWYEFSNGGATHEFHLVHH